MKKLLALLLVLAMVACLFVGCKKSDKKNDDTTPATDPVATDKVDDGTGLTLKNAEYGTDYVTLYSEFGKDVSIADVTEDENGFAYIERDGETYELGLDFLTMAMVYNTEVPEGGKFETADDVYAEWFRLYLQRWNYLLPEIPLYSNEYYDLYNTKITGVQENPTNPYWGVAQALIDWKSEKDDNSIIIGNTTDLSGLFRFATYGASSPGAANYDIQKLVEGLETVSTNKEGGYQWNDTVVKSHEEEEHEDGSKTVTIEIYDDLKFSDGSDVTAKNYLAYAMAFSTPVATEAAGRDHSAGMQYVGYKEFAAYDGTNDGVDVNAKKDDETSDETEAPKEPLYASKVFKGVRLLDTYKFAITISAEYLPYFYDLSYVSFSPAYLPLWLNDADIVDDGEGCYLTDNFYTKNGDSYTYAAHINSSANNNDTTYPYSGAYVVESYDESDKSAILSLNTYFKGNYEGVKPSIGKVVYKKIVSATQMADFTSGGLDFIAGVTGGDETNEALKTIEESNGAFASIHYSRAGYGKLGFRADFGPVQFTEVRQAIAYCMDRATFAKDFTGGFGGVVDGPYYSGAWMYKEAVANGMMLDPYATSLDSAIQLLVDGGWVYDKDGNEYTSGVRYKKLAANEVDERDINYHSKDNAYKTTKVGDYYYMPLVINWFGTADNPFTEQLVTGFMENENIKNAGFEIQNNIGEFYPMLDELYQQDVYGYYSGEPLYSAFNFATGYNSAAYDYAYNCSLDPFYFENYSQWYIKDEADAYWINK